MFKGLNRQKKILASYVLTLYDNKLVRQQDLTPDIEIQLGEISKIVQSKNGALTIISKNKRDTIVVPYHTNHIKELQALLAKSIEIDTQQKTHFINKNPWAISLLTILLITVVFVSNNKWLVGFAGLSLTIGLTYSISISFLSKNLDKKTKKGMFLAVPVILFIIVITYFKVFAEQQ